MLLVCTVGGFQSPAAVPVVTRISREKGNINFLMLIFTFQNLELS